MSEPWAESALLRQGLYRFVGGALLPPDDSTFDTLLNAAEYLRGFGIAGYAFFPQWNAMVSAIAEASIVDATADYVTLFASGTDMALCPPVESYYRSDASGGAAGEVGAAVVRMTRALGFAPRQSAMPPDHVSYELEIMSALCGREASAWKMHSGAEAAALMADEELFLASHAGAWLPAFAEKADAVGAPMPYKGIVEFAHAFTVHDLDYIRAARRYFEGAA